MPQEPENLGLLALMLLHDSRRDTRTNEAGDLVLLEEQDRTQWDAARIAEGRRVLETAINMRRPGPYQLQAAIAALHAEAKTPAETDWAQIATLYRELKRLQPSAVVTLNHAVAVAMRDGPGAGLLMLEQANAAGELSSYHLFHSARADLLRRQNQLPEAVAAYQRALELATNAVERRFLLRRLRELGGFPC
jgi:RNA polymerase sigma-70 factor (ECF subfamily)